MSLTDAKRPMPRRLVWVDEKRFRGFGCSECGWVFKPSDSPTGNSFNEVMLNVELQRDREFSSHVCARHPKNTSAQRGRSLVMNSSAQEAAKVASRFIPTCWICDKAITLENCAIDEYGKGLHAKCYAAKLAHPKGKSIGEKEERWRELCVLAAKEQDPQRLYTLVQEINDFLKQRERIKHQGKPPVRD